MGEEGGPSLGWPGNVSADGGNMRLESIGRWTTGEESVHPGSAALVFAGKPVGVEAAQNGSVLVPDALILRFGIPGCYSSLLLNPNPVESARDLEQSSHNLFERKVGRRN